MVGFSAEPAQRSPGHQFSIGRPALSGGRCLVPASHFFEFTGSKSPKSKWKFTKAGEDWFCFAGLWRRIPDGAGEAFTLLTTEPGSDVAPIHDRQMVILDRVDWLAWLDLTLPETELLRPLSGRVSGGRASPVIASVSLARNTAIALLDFPVPGTDGIREKNLLGI